MWRLTFAAAAVVALYACAQPHAVSSREAAFFKANPQCTGKMGNLVGQLQCLPPVLREPLVASIVHSSSFDNGARCNLRLRAARAIASDGDRGEMRVPATCDGRPSEITFTLSGHFAGYVGTRRCYASHLRVTPANALEAARC